MKVWKIPLLMAISILIGALPLKAAEVQKPIKVDFFPSTPHLPQCGETCREQTQNIYFSTQLVSGRYGQVRYDGAVRNLCNITDRVIGASFGVGSGALGGANCSPGDLSLGVQTYYSIEGSAYSVCPETTGTVNLGSRDDSWISVTQGQIKIVRVCARTSSAE